MYVCVRQVEMYADQLDSGSNVPDACIMVKLAINQFVITDWCSPGWYFVYGAITLRISFILPHCRSQNRVWVSSEKSFDTTPMRNGNAMETIQRRLNRRCIVCISR